MLPLDTPTVFHLILIGVACLGALAIQSGWRWRSFLLFLALALVIWYLKSEVPGGQYAGLALLIVSGAAVIALVFGAGLGAILRSAVPRTPTCIALVFCAATAVAGVVLYQQYVPDECRQSPLRIRIAGEALRLPAALAPLVERDGKLLFFGRADRKSDFAHLCRIGANGEREIRVESVRITPASSFAAMSLICNANAPPGWCGSYAPEPYRHASDVLIAPRAVNILPLPYWKEGGAPERQRQGDLTSGSVCLFPEDEDDRTECWIWQPFGDDARVTVRAANLEPAFEGMPVEAARAILVQVLEQTLSILRQ